MDRLFISAYENTLGILKTGEPLVVAGLFCAVLALGFLLGKGAKHTHKTIHMKWKGRKAATKELLE